jgi:hypothetical protein
MNKRLVYEAILIVFPSLFVSIEIVHLKLNALNELVELHHFLI